MRETKMVNARTKGQSGEREVVKMLNDVLVSYYQENNIEYNDQMLVQRNQNQSAIGGCDLVNTFNFAIEVKRCEKLEIEKWWKQTCAQAQALNKTPVLIYRQSRKGWRVVLNAEYAIEYDHFTLFQCDMHIGNFINIFESVVAYRKGKQ
jgi:hypothetical protein